MSSAGTSPSGAAGAGVRAAYGTRGQAAARRALAAVFVASHFVPVHLVGADTFAALTKSFSTRFGVRGISPGEFRRLRGGVRLRVLDVRTASEQSVSIIPGALRLAERPTVARLREVAEGAEVVVVYCAAGYRSARAISRLSKPLRSKFRNLDGGIIGYARTGGKLVQPGRKGRVYRVHGYDRFWARFVTDPHRAVLRGN